MLTMMDMSKFSWAKLQCELHETQMWVSMQHPYGGDFITVMCYRRRQAYLHSLQEEEQRCLNITPEWRKWLRLQEEGEFLLSGISSIWCRKILVTAPEIARGGGGFW